MDTAESIQQLFKRVDAELSKGQVDPEKIKDMMNEYVVKHDDWKEYVHFNEHKYARNLVNTSENCELMVICWMAHQASPIHNHAGQNCWAAVLEGNIKETHFKYKNTQSCEGEGPLEITQDSTYQKGSVSYIHDDIALHVLEPVGGKRGITLHLYSKPITWCNIYNPIDGKITRRVPGFYTIGKKIQPEESQGTCAVGQSK